MVRDVDRIAGLSVAERVAFWKSWTPERLELDTTLVLPVPLSEFGGASELTVGECWGEVTRRLALTELLIGEATELSLGISPDVRDRRGLPRRDSFDTAPRSVAYGLDEGSCVLALRKRPSNFSSKLSASILIVAICVVGMCISIRLRSQILSSLVAFPFLYWCLLAILCWLCLPVAWPGWILLAAACFLGIGNWFDHRRARAYR